MKKLEIGSGIRPTPGYEHLDVLELPHIEYVCDARMLPFDDNVYDEIYSHWVLEHFAWREMFKVLNEWKRVLRPGGILKVITNNQEAHNRCLVQGKINWREWVRLTYGMREMEELKEWMAFTPDAYEPHKIGFTEKSLVAFLQEAGFENIQIQSGWHCREDDGEIKCPGLVATAKKPK